MSCLVCTDVCSALTYPWFSTLPLGPLSWNPPHCDHAVTSGCSSPILIISTPLTNRAFVFRQHSHLIPTLSRASWCYSSAYWIRRWCWLWKNASTLPSTTLVLVSNKTGWKVGKGGLLLDWLGSGWRRAIVFISITCPSGFYFPLSLVC